MEEPHHNSQFITSTCNDCTHAVGASNKLIDVHFVIHMTSKRAFWPNRVKTEYLHHIFQIPSGTWQFPCVFNKKNPDVHSNGDIKAACILEGSRRFKDSPTRRFSN